jgi:hypothetical protein
MALSAASFPAIGKGGPIHSAQFLPEIPYRSFDEFIAPRTDRFALLRRILEELKLKSSVLTVAGNRHILVSPAPEDLAVASPVDGAPVVLVAHYDRVADSPGANDNSASVFLLIETALKLREKKALNWLIIFTDKEELAPGEGIRNQGSYTLARGLRGVGLGKGRFYTFDACGSGDTLIISTTADYLMKNERGLGIARTRQAVRQLRNRALETARRLQLDRVLLAPTPFSDDAGFLRAGIAAQTVTVLPTREAVPFVSLLRKAPGFADALVKREVQDAWDQQLIPETWRSLNGPQDSPLRLTPRYFSRVVRFALELCKS